MDPKRRTVVMLPLPAYGLGAAAALALGRALAGGAPKASFGRPKPQKRP